MNFRASPDVPNLALDENFRVDPFERINRLPSLADVFLDRESR